MRLSSPSINQFAYPQFGAALARSADSLTVDTSVSITDRFGEFFTPTEAERRDFRAFAARIYHDLEQQAEDGALSKHSPASGGSRGPVREELKEKDRKIHYRSYFPLPQPYSWQTTYRSTDGTIKFTLQDHGITAEAFDPTTGKLIHTVEFKPDTVESTRIQYDERRLETANIKVCRRFDTNEITAVFHHADGRIFKVLADGWLSRTPIRLTADDLQTYEKI